jgi:hypothetical protein
MLLGLAIGGGAGFAIGAIDDARSKRETGEEHFAATLFGTIGLAAGAGVGAAIPSHPTIYRAKRIRRGQ